MVCMVLDERCNWSCKYCDRPKIESPKEINFDLLKQYYPRIIEWVGDVPLHISGGETALVDKEVLDYIFSFKKKPIVETNGLWFEKGYHKKYNSEKIVYHCVQDLDEDIKHDIRHPYNVEYLIVIHHLNIGMIDDFILRNGHRRYVFQLYYAKFLGGHEKFNLTIGDYFYLMRLYRGFVNSYEIIKRVSPTNINKLRKECFQKFYFPGFDFVNGRIKFCKQSHSYTDWVPLNETNFKLLLDGKLKSSKEMDEICKTCIEVVRYI